MSQDSPPAAGSAIWQHRQDQAHHCSIFQRGRHRDGTFIRVFVPDAARQPGAELRVILYLHGFALCLPSFYEQHMLKLAEQGWIVLYPDYQRTAAIAKSRSARPPQPEQARQLLPPGAAPPGDCCGASVRMP